MKMKKDDRKFLGGCLTSVFLMVGFFVLMLIFC